MKPIPEDAIPVVEILRKDVRRPSELPHIGKGCNDMPVLRWKSTDRRTFLGQECCPMGLHPEATDPCPYDDDSAFPASFDEIEAFADWWDSLELSDASEAMDAIWPSGS